LQSRVDSGRVSVEGTENCADDQQNDEGDEVRRNNDAAFLHVRLPTLRPADSRISPVPRLDDLRTGQRNEAGARDRNDLGEDLG
jgi:hypothetical protein